MAMRGGPRLQVGSAAWVAEERSSALDIAQSEIEEFSFSARNELDWLNEHMADIFSENQTNVAELFKTPGKLRGKTPMTVRRANLAEVRVPLADVFSSTPKNAPNPFAISNLAAQSRTPKIQVAQDKPDQNASFSVARSASPVKSLAPAHPIAALASSIPFVDSGYHGSQPFDTTNLAYCDNDDDVDMVDSPDGDAEPRDFAISDTPEPQDPPSPSLASHGEEFESADEGETRQVTAHLLAGPSSEIGQPRSSPLISRAKPQIMSPKASSPKKPASPVRMSPARTSPIRSSPQKSSPQKALPERPSPSKQMKFSSPRKGFPKPTENLSSERHEEEHRAENQNHDYGDDDDDDDDAGDQPRSPSEPPSPVRGYRSSINFASLPAREPLASKKSLGGNRTSVADFTRPSIFGRQTGGKSLGNVTRHGESEDSQDDMDLDDEVGAQDQDATTKIVEHNKTYTQMLHEQISMLGKSQGPASRSSKSLASMLPSQGSASASQIQQHTESGAELKRTTSPKSPPPRPLHPSATPGTFPEDDDDEWIDPPKSTAAAPAPRFSSPRPQLRKSLSADVMENVAGKESVSGGEFDNAPVDAVSSWKSPIRSPLKTGYSAHSKSASVPAFAMHDQFESHDEEEDDVSLKKTVSAMSIPALAPVKEDMFAPAPKSPTRGFRDHNPLNKIKSKMSSLFKSAKDLTASGAIASVEGRMLASASTTRLGYHPNPSVDSLRKPGNVSYPDLSKQLSAVSRSGSPIRSASPRRTRQSTERDRAEVREREKEAKAKEKEIKRLEKESEKLEKARKKEQDKARVFNKEQERKQQLAIQREQEHTSQAQVRQDFQTPAPARKLVAKPKAQVDNKDLADEPDAEMADATATVTMTMPPSSIQRPGTSTSMRPPAQQANRRPKPPAKENLSKSTRQPPPTVIRLNPGTIQRPGFHPTKTAPTPVQPPSLQRQPSTKSLNEKRSVPDFKASGSLASKKRKEQEEQEAQRKREAKAKAEAEEKRKAAQRAAIEKAKQTPAPPPAVRSQPNGPPDYGLADKPPARPPSRLGSTMHQDRLVNMALPNTGKPSMKRPHQQDEGSLRAQQQRPPQPSYSSQESKRQRLSDEFNDDVDMADSQPLMKAPVRAPSVGPKRELVQPKSVFSHAYSKSSTLHQSTVKSQHQSAIKGGYLDTQQFAKGAIPFKVNPASQAGPSGQPLKTPARNVANGGGIPRSSAKPAGARSSPRFNPQDGEAIELEEIQTDDDDDDDHGDLKVAAWADSPALKAALMAQEHVDPMQVFGPPAPLDMEAVFNKTKDRWHKFRARTSSANWSGTDQLSADEIKKEQWAREKITRDGGWSYELSKNL
ncbi:hypothetical protein QBC42DRAFT_232103 [Cladorrhinum samala]|uniref:Inner centromere protein ARK-binding domain-containing protein n=1 Tax=Cladorrhinum samala TaxID=585594 RepID=A0AAV9HIH5_9PEZI|nr:hypothetical protein QBC42DRAFT_232103 [Cladorrhinum samala]